MGPRSGMQIVQTAVCQLSHGQLHIMIALRLRPTLCKLFHEAMLPLLRTGGCQHKKRSRLTLMRCRAKSSRRESRCITACQACWAAAGTLFTACSSTNKACFLVKGSLQTCGTYACKPGCECTEPIAPRSCSAVETIVMTNSDKCERFCEDG